RPAAHKEIWTKRLHRRWVLYQIGTALYVSQALHVATSSASPIAQQRADSEAIHRCRSSHRRRVTAGSQSPCGPTAGHACLRSDVEAADDWSRQIERVEQRSGLAPAAVSRSPTLRPVSAAVEPCEQTSQ